MLIKRFNHNNKLIDLDFEKHKWTELEGDKTVNRVVGVGDLLGTSCVAMIARNNSLFLYLDKILFDLFDESLAFSYEHLTNGLTIFKASNSSITKEISYPSWHTKSLSSSVAFGGDDVEEDICSYINFMIIEKKMASSLLEKYSNI